MDNSRRLELEAKFAKARERLVRALKWIAQRGADCEKLADRYLEIAREAMASQPVNAVALAERVADKFANEAIGVAKKALARAEAELANAHRRLSTDMQGQVDGAKKAAGKYEERGLFSSALGQVSFALRIVRDGLPPREMRAEPRPTRTGKTARKGSHRKNPLKPLKDAAIRASMKGGGGAKKK